MKSNRRLWTALVLGIAVPGIVSIVIAYLIFGDLTEAGKAMYNFRGQPNRTKDAVTSLFLVISSLLGIYSLISTIVFSYLIWKVSVSTLQVTERSEKLEIQRDQTIIQENALIVYYDVQRQITNLVDLYESLVISKKEPSPSRLYLSTDWMKNVASLRNDLSEQEMNYLFRFYEEFLTLQSILEIHKDPVEITKHVKKLSEKYLVEGVPLPLIIQYSNWLSTESKMSLKLLLINRKIHKATFPSNKIKLDWIEVDGEKDVMNIEVDKYPYFRGGSTSTLFDAHGNNILVGSFTYDGAEFLGGKRIHGSPSSIAYNIVIQKAESDEGSPVVTNEIVHVFKAEKDIYNAEIKNNEPVNGLVIKYNDEGVKIYEGYLIDGKREGEGTSYRNGKKYFSGIWENDRPKNGELRENGKLLFKGEIKNGNKPWEGEAFELTKDSFYEFTGILKNGLPFRGSGYNFRQNQYGLSYDEELEHEYMDPEDEQEMHRQMFEEEHARQNEEARNAHMWEEYIKADWDNGEATEKEPIESNIRVLYYK
ncbi:MULTISPECIES: hypothetical protein [unclassified Paenibacillus]|uniref:toxin-antitoxin system YwqK family antitoxin n=1 Tax=unclassified Paenibacillus TaxID=185978 RepID=UPI00095504F5|nr:MULTISPECIES: hypothetical protein [unclassified Paenibacillus]ASS67597.1 hypothetical protein CIC07_16655 [Paenibacillus sp. RUD330]SIQ71320.1 hypothetical protein SAMN05880555_2095 [Paenibacillus sp. RU4X]SIQ92994.1 hypothetical protein SAMN05880570_2093 [Paenibacillus sp. RU4T]